MRTGDERGTTGPMHRVGRGEAGIYAEARTERKCDAVPLDAVTGRRPRVRDERDRCRRYGRYPVGRYRLCRQHADMLERGGGVQAMDGAWLPIGRVEALHD